VIAIESRLHLCSLAIDRGCEYVPRHTLPSPSADIEGFILECTKSWVANAGS